MVCCDSILFRSVCLSGNGYIEGKELENFFRELEIARRGAGVVSSGMVKLNTVMHTDHLGYTILFYFLPGPFEPHIQRKDEGVHAEV